MKRKFINFGYAPKFISRRFPGTRMTGIAAYKEDGEETPKVDTPEGLLKELKELRADLEKKSQEDANKAVGEIAKAFDEKLAAYDKAIEELKAVKPEVTAAELKAIKDEAVIQQRVIDRMQISMKNGKPAQEQKKTFNDILEETINEHAEEIKSFKPNDPEKRFRMKAVGDMTIANNFPSSGTFNVDIRNQLIESPYNRVWLGDILPQGTSNGSSILYPKENGGEGGAALWTDPTADKAQMDFDLTGQSAYFKWIAGFVIIERGMLDDISFLNSYLRNKMLISLKIAENDFILNGSSDSNPVQGFLDVAATYTGSYTANVDRIIDAAWGQIVEDTFDFYNPTTVILTPRESVGIGLNKAAGSGEYNLPAGSVAFAQGQLAIAGLQVVKTVSVGTGNFLAFDKNATMFITRMQPELRMFEDAALAKKNKIMFRVEERATLAIFNNAALVQGTLAAES